MASIGFLHFLSADSQQETIKSALKGGSLVLPPFFFSLQTNSLHKPMALLYVPNCHPERSEGSRVFAAKNGDPSLRSG